MSIIIRDEHLERLIDAVRERRGDKTMAKTACDLIREKLTEMDVKESERPVREEVATA